MSGRRRRPRRRIAAAAAALATALVLAMPGLGAATASAAPRASFGELEGQLMCVICHEPLAEANSPEAIDERNYLRLLIARGEDRRQIERAMVAAYGPAVLASPPAHGFNVLVYVIPPVVVVCGIAVVLITLPRWRARSRAGSAAPIATGAPLDPGDARRLDEDLGRFA